MASRIHQILPNAYNLMCFDRNNNGKRDVKFSECDYLLVKRCVKLTLVPLQLFLKAYHSSFSGLGVRN